jgi:hypothetical protein
MTQELRVLLESQKEKHEQMIRSGVVCPWVFPYNGKPFKSFKTAWNKAAVKGGYSVGSTS